jgi:hypothetical protein
MAEGGLVGEDITISIDPNKPTNHWWEVEGG